MKTYKGYTFKPAVQELIHKVAKDLGKTVKIRWNAGVQTAGIDQYNNIYLSDVADDAILNQNDLIKYCGYGVHELLHSLYTNFNYCSDIAYVRALHNGIEDAWIEHKGIAKLVTGNAGGLLSGLVEMMTDVALVEVKDWSDPKQYPYALAVYLRRHATTKVPLANGLEPIYAHVAAKQDSCVDSGDTLKLAEWVYAQLKTLPEDKPKKGSGKPSDGSQSGDQGEGKGEGAGQQENGSGNARQPKPNTVPVNPEPTLGEGKAGNGGSYSEDASLKPNGYHVEAGALYAPNASVPAKLRYSVKRLFEDSGRDEFQRNRKAGSVNVHALPTAGFSDKVFKRRHEAEGIDSAVAIVLDVSGSMSDAAGSGSRIAIAAEACMALVDVLNRAGVATTVLTFAGNTSVLKPFNMSAATAIKELCKVRTSGSTNDYFAVRYAHKVLFNRPEQRKVCLVLTDGDGDEISTSEQIAVGERLGVTTIGIGIDLDVSRVYPKNATVKNLSELGAVAFDKIKLAA